MIKKTFRKLGDLMLKNKGVKIGGGIVGGGSLLALIFTVYTWTLSGIDSKAKASEVRMYRYVDLKHEAALMEFRATAQASSSKQDNMMKILFRLEKRLYELNKRK